MNRLRTVVLGALLALGPAGCVLFDSRGDLEIEPPGTLYALDVLALEVKGPFQSFSVSFDGRDVDGTFPANQKVVVPAGHLATGEHRLVVMALDTAVPRSATRTLVVDKSPRLVSLDPPEGLVTTGEPFAVQATFSGPAFPTLAAGASPTMSGPAGPILTRTSLLAGGSTLRIEIDQPLEAVGPVNLTLSAGGSFTWHLGPWSAPGVVATFVAPASDTSTNGTIDIAATVFGAMLPPALELLAGDHTLGELLPPDWSFHWDTATVPEGAYPLTLRARGYAVSSSQRVVTVDRTPPSVVSCHPEASSADDAWQSDCVVVTLSEPVLNLAPALLVGGAPRQLIPVQGGADGSVRLCPSSEVVLPAVQTVDLGPAVDQAGNPVRPFTCAMNLWAWRRPCGVEPVALDGTGVVSSEIALDYDLTGWTPQGSTCSLLWLDGAGDSIRAAIAQGTAGWAWGVAPAVWTPPATITDLVRARDVAVWSESGRFVRSELGSSGAWTKTPLAAAPGSRHLVLADTGNAVAWVEPAPEGGSLIRVESRTDSRGPWKVNAGPNDDPTVVADFPAIGDGGTSGILLAWLETPAGGGPAQVRAARQDPYTLAWTALGATLNLDPTRPSSEPAVWVNSPGGGRYLAWTEDGRVLVRDVDGPVMPAESMNSDASRVARSPRFSGDYPLALVFVEAGPDGEEIRLRRPSYPGWRLVDEIANAGVPGPVGQIVTTRTGGLAWIDEAGLVRVRVLNR